MRIKHRYLKWDSNSNIIKSIMKILDKYSIIYEYKEDLSTPLPSFKYSIEFHLYEDNQFFKELQQALSNYDILPQIGTEYNEEDIKNAEWFIIHVGGFQYPQPDNDFGYIKKTFNIDNYCELCGIGKTQDAPFRLKTEPKQTNNQFWGIHWEHDAIFVRQEAKNIIEKENIEGVSFTNPILDKKNIKIEGFYQLHINKILNKGFNSYNTKTITCKVNNEEDCNTDVNLKYCGRIKFHHPMIGGYLFDRAIFNPEYDIIKSEEYFGSGGSASKLLIVSKKLKEIIDKNKLRGLKFTPIVHQMLTRVV